MSNAISNIQELLNKNPTPEQFQKILSALRGPDFVKVDDNGFVPKGGLERLKFLTTARIRAIVTPNYFGDINPIPLTEYERIERNEFILYSPRHFKSHYQEAVLAIKEVFGYDLRHEKPVEFQIKATKGVE